MIKALTKPLIACTTKHKSFCENVEAAAEKIGTDFFSSDSLDLTIQECDRRKLSCVVVDFENRADLPDAQRAKEIRDHQFMLVAVPKGDVDAAFKAASMGAVNVFEKPVGTDELIVNLEMALASETQLAEVLSSPGRFSDYAFDELTHREKAILGLLYEGEPNKRVAAILDIGLRTVEADRAGILKKLSVNTFVEAVRLVTELTADRTGTRKQIFGRMRNNRT